MIKYKALLRVTMGVGFKGLKSSLSSKKDGNVSKGGFFAILALMLLVFGFVVAMMGVMLGQAAIYLNDTRSEIFLLMMLIVSATLLLFGIIYLLNVMYFSNDNEFLLALPVKNSTIYLAKITAVYFYLFIISAFLLGIGGVSFGISSLMPWQYYIGLIIAIVLSPIFPLFVATLVSFPLMYIVSYIKKNRILSTLFVIILIAVFAGLYIYIFTAGMGVGSGAAAEDGIALPAELISALNTLKYVFYFNTAIANLFIDGVNIAVSVLALIGSNALFAVVCLALSMLLYRRGMSKQLENSGETIKISKEKGYNRRSARSALFRNDLKMLVRTPMVFFYVLMELIFPTIFVIIITSTFTGVDAAANPLVTEIIQLMKLILITLFGLIFACGMNFLAISAISREGKSFFMMKIVPMPIQNQLDIKGYTAFAMPVVSLLITCCVSAIMGSIPVYSAFLLFIFTTVLAYGFTFYQVGLDVKYPKLDWDNITQVMQNNMNSLRCMGVSLVVTLISGIIMAGEAFLVFYGILPILVGEIIMWCVLIAGAVAVAFAMRRSYLKNIVVDFEKIEC